MLTLYASIPQSASMSEKGVIRAVEGEEVRSKVHLLVSEQAGCPASEAKKWVQVPQ